MKKEMFRVHTKFVLMVGMGTRMLVNTIELNWGAQGSPKLVLAAITAFEMLEVWFVVIWSISYVGQKWLPNDDLWEIFKISLLTMRI